jgi:2-hydroxycyclohexanecarboxyl-CoA dehydrogenase
MELGLKGKTMIVTGGGSNIGRGIVLLATKEGCNVVNAEISEKHGPKVAQEASALGGGGKTIWVKTDVTNFESVQAMVERTLKEFGKIDILVNNVGWTYDRLFVEKKREEWEKEIALNYWSDINCIQAVLPHMIEKKYGRVIGISSDAGRMGEFREAVYAGCKAGVIALSKSLAKENAQYGITFNVVSLSVTVPEKLEDASELSMHAPGGFGYDFAQKIPDLHKKMMGAYPLAKAYNRLGRPEDIANTVLFFASDAACWITGQVLSVNGGFVMP